MNLMIIILLQLFLVSLASVSYSSGKKKSVFVDTIMNCFCLHVIIDEFWKLRRLRELNQKQQVRNKWAHFSCTAANFGDQSPYTATKQLDANHERIWSEIEHNVSQSNPESMELGRRSSQVIVLWELFTLSTLHRPSWGYNVPGKNARRPFQIEKLSFRFGRGYY